MLDYLILSTIIIIIVVEIIRRFFMAEPPRLADNVENEIKNTDDENNQDDENLRPSIVKSEIIQNDNSENDETTEQQLEALYQIDSLDEEEFKTSNNDSKKAAVSMKTTEHDTIKRIDYDAEFEIVNNEQAVNNCLTYSALNTGEDFVAPKSQQIVEDNEKTMEIMDNEDDHLDEISFGITQNDADYNQAANNCLISSALSLESAEEDFLASKSRETVEKNKETMENLYERPLMEIVCNNNASYNQAANNDLIPAAANLKSTFQVFEALEFGRSVTVEEKEETKKFMNEMKFKTHNNVTQNQLTMFVLGKTLEASGFEMIISKTKIENDETMKLHAQLCLTGALFDCNLYEAKFIHPTITNYNASNIKQNPQLEQTFITEFKRFICSITNAKYEEINVISLKNGSVVTIFSAVRALEFEIINSQNNKTPLGLTYAGTQQIKLAREILLNDGIFNHQYDMDYTSQHFKGHVEKRGQEDYYFPFGWKRLGLNLNYFTYFKNNSLDWLSMSNHENEWCVAFHGLRGDAKNSLKLIIYDSNGKPTLIPGFGQACQNHLDQNKRNIEGYNKPCGIGVYCTPKIEVAEGYTTSVPFDGKKYRIALQCRINPKKFRNAGGDYYVINDFVNDIRPYGILTKCE